MAGDATHSPVQLAAAWLKRRSVGEKAALGFVGAVLTLLLLYAFVEDHDNLFIMAEAVHFTGIGVLIYKLTLEKSCSGLSLKSQILTAIFLAIRLICSFVMECVWQRATRKPFPGPTTFQVPTSRDRNRFHRVLRTPNSPNCPSAVRRAW